MSEEMKQDIQKLRKDMADVRATELNIAVALTRIEGKMDGIVEQMATLATRDQVGAVITRLEGFCGIVEASRDERKLSDESFFDVRKTLQDHEARLIRLEPRKKS